MEEQQRVEIGQRIRELREASPQTNRSIADHVGVGERSVANWIAGNTGITYDHAKEVAALFDVDVRWLWDGKERGGTPDVMAQLDEKTLTSLRDQLTKLNEDLAEIKDALGISHDESHADPAEVAEEDVAALDEQPGDRRRRSA